MQPFESIAAVTQWYCAEMLSEKQLRPCSLLLDFGPGFRIQRREIRVARNQAPIIGFPDPVHKERSK